MMVASVSWDKDGILLVKYFKKGATITAKYYTSLLDKVKQALVTKQQKKLLKQVSFFPDNASSHMAAITQQKLADLHFEVLKQPAYSPHLAPSDYHMFPNLIKHLKGMKFSTIEDAMYAGFPVNLQHSIWVV
jgi:histone-lysine N-methyltransferase SETMAR